MFQIFHLFRIFNLLMLIFCRVFNVSIVCQILNYLFFKISFFFQNFIFFQNLIFLFKISFFFKIAFFSKISFFFQIHFFPFLAEFLSNFIYFQFLVKLYQIAIHLWYRWYFQLFSFEFFTLLFLSRCMSSRLPKMFFDKISKYFFRFLTGVTTISKRSIIPGMKV